MSNSLLSFTPSPAPATDRQTAAFLITKSFPHTRNAHKDDVRIKRPHRVSGITCRIINAAAMVGLAPLAAAEPPQGAVDALLSSAARASKPGCSVAIGSGGRLAYAGGYGLADLQTNAPIGPDTIFDVGSIAKQFTAASLVLLAQRGQLSLDDDIRRYVPELLDHGTPIRIRHLLNHTSGLRDYVDLLVLSGARFHDPVSPNDALRMLGRQRHLNFAPGSSFQYSNSGFFIAGLIVERVAGKSLAEFTRDNIFQPLRMTHSGFRRSDRLPFSATAHSYSPASPDGWTREDFGWTTVGDGGLFTTARDLALWAENLRNPTIGGPGLVEALQTPGRLNSGEVIEYGLGLTLGRHRNLPTIGHNGAWEGYQAESIRFPAQGLFVAVLCNSNDSDPTTLARQIADLYLPIPAQSSEATAATTQPAAAQRPTVAVALGALRHWAGRYRNPDSGVLREILFQNGGLAVQLGRAAHPLRPVAPAEFEVEGRNGLFLRFSPGEHGGPRILEQINPLGIMISFSSLAAPIPRSQLEAFTGAFRNDEINAVYEVFTRAGVLMLRRPNYSPSELLPLADGSFATTQDMVAPIILQFASDGTRRRSFRLTVGDIHDLHFVRIRRGTSHQSK